MGNVTFPVDGLQSSLSPTAIPQALFDRRYVFAVMPGFVPDGVADNHAALQAWLTGLTGGSFAMLPLAANSYMTSASLTLAPPAGATVGLWLEGTIKKTAAFSDTGANSGGLVIDGSAGGVTVYIEAPRNKLVIDGNQAAGATAVGIRVKGGATVVMTGGKYANNGNTGVFCTDASTDVRCYDVESSSNASGGGATGFTVTAGAKLRTYGNCIADGNEVAGFLFTNTAAAGCVLNGRARNNVFAGSIGTGASLRSYGGRIERFSTGSPSGNDGNGNGGVAVEFGGDNWDLGRLELYNGGNPNGAQSNPSGFGLALYAATRCKLTSLVAGMNSGYHVVFGKITGALSTAISNGGSGITTGATTIPCAGTTLPSLWPTQGVLMIVDAFTVDITAGSRALSIDTGPTGAIPIPGSQVTGFPSIASFTGDLDSTSFVVNNVSSFTGLVVGQYVNGTRISSGTKITVLTPGSNQLTLDTKPTSTGATSALTVSTLPQTGTYVISTAAALPSFGVNFAPFAAASNVAVTMGAELVLYRGISGASFTNCARGWFGSVAAAHPDSLTFTATTTTGSPTLTAVSSFTGLLVGMPLSGPGVGGTILALNPGASQITMSANATANGTGVTIFVPSVTQNPCAHHNQLGTVLGDSTANWDKDPGVAFSGGSTHNTIAAVEMNSVPAAASFGEGAAGNDHNVIGAIVAQDCSQEIVSFSGGANNRIDRITGRDCAPGAYLINTTATNWPVHDNAIGSLAHKIDFAAAPLGNIQNANGAVGNYIEGKTADQLNAPTGRRYNMPRFMQPVNQANALVSGTMYVFGGDAAIIPAGKTVTSISLWAGTTAAAGITHLWFGLVDRRVETVAGSVTTDLPNSGLLVVSADTPAGTGGNAWTANAALTLTIPSFRPQDDMPYGVVFCCVATTMPTLTGLAEGSLIASLGNPSPKISAVTIQTGLTTPVAIGTAMSGLSSFGNLPYHEIAVS